MKIALFSDVHGNLTALEAVLDRIKGYDFDLLVFAGDLCCFGPRPAECLRLLREQPIVSVYGNTDESILGRGTPPGRFGELIQWTADRLTDEEKAWLGDLPFSLTFNPTADPRTGLHVVHANPRDVNQVIYLSEEDQRARFGEVHQSDAELAAVLEGLEAGVLAYGHLHIPSTRIWHDHLLVNVSSVSLPRDGDALAKYAVLTWANGRWTAEHVRVPYDIAAEVAAFRQFKPPGWQESIASLEAYDMNG